MGRATVGGKSVSVGETASLSKTISEADIVLFAGISGDFNPLHLDAEYAKTTRFGERIAHGILTAGLISAVLGTRLPGPGGIYLGQTLNFRKPVKIGDTITATAKVTSYDPEKRIVKLETNCHNQDGVLVLTGEAVLLLERD
ncbi:MAG: MaoC family dehydratase [Chloroflexi bacterium]|nr:MaoC family dehydratase [Chloroflexota bacterium]